MSPAELRSGGSLFVAQLLIAMFLTMFAVWAWMTAQPIAPVAALAAIGFQFTCRWNSIGWGFQIVWAFFWVLLLS